MTRPGRLVAKLSILVVSTILALLLAEVASRYLYHVEISHFEDCQGRRAEIRLDDPELEVVLKPHFCGKLIGSEFRNSVRTNGAGYRDSQEFSEDKHGAYRIFALGDSYTFGWGVEQDQTYLSVLGRKLALEMGRNVDTFNLGVWSYGTLQEIKVFDRFRNYQPDLVILQFYGRDGFVQESGNDLVDNYLFREWYQTAHLPQNQRHRSNVEASVIAHERWTEYLAQHCNLCRIGVLAFGAFAKSGFHPKGNPQLRDAAWQITQDALRNFDRDLQSLNIKCILLWIPPPGTVHEQDASVANRLKSFGLGNVVVVSPLELMRADVRKYYYSLDTHWRPAGHELAAELLLQTIKEKALLPRAGAAASTAATH